MNLLYVNDLIDYASKLGILVKDENNNFILNDKEYKFNYNELDSNENLPLINELRANLPITEVIDLVREAISLGIVYDISNEYKLKCLLDLNGYIDINSKNEYSYSELESSGYLSHVIDSLRLDPSKVGNFKELSHVNNNRRELLNVREVKWK